MHEADCQGALNFIPLQCNASWSVLWLPGILDWLIMSDDLQASSLDPMACILTYYTVNLFVHVFDQCD